MSSDTTDKGTLSDRLIDAVLRTLIGGLMKMPFERRTALMGSVVRKVIGPLAGYRKRAMKNLALIYPDMPEAERSRIADGVLDNMGRTLIENYSWRELGDRLKVAPVHGAGLPHIAEAKAAGRPVLFVTGHFSNHEVPRQVLTAMGYEIGGLYRPMKNKLVNEHYAKTMTEMSGPVFAQGRRGTAGFARHLKSGGMGTLLFDVAVPEGVLVDFLGREAMTATSAADIALRMDALVVPYFAVRTANGFEVFIEEPIAHTDAATMMTEMTRRLEAHVTAHPEQWFWVHNRWKPQKARAAATIAPGPGS